MEKLIKLLSVRTIQGKIGWLVIVSCGLALLVCCTTLLFNNMSLLKSSKVVQLTALAEVLASNSSVAVSFEESDAANELLQALQKIKSVESASLILANEDLLANYRRDNAAIVGTDEIPTLREGYHFHQNFLDIAVPIIEDEDELGTLLIRSNLEDIRMQRKKLWTVMFWVMIVSLFVAVLASYYLNQRICRPIGKLSDVAHQITTGGNYSLRIEHHSSDELGNLCTVFNEMLDRIQHSEQDLCEARDQLEERVETRTRELSEANEQLKLTMSEREELSRHMIELSHCAGRAEIATGVLHNVGNVLNSINIAAGVVDETLRNSRVVSLVKAASLLNDQKCLAEFFTLDERGQKFPRYLTSLGQKLTHERDSALDEVQSLVENLNHVKTIVAMQQSYAGVSGVQEATTVNELMQDAELLNSSSMTKHEVVVTRDFEDLPEVLIEKQKVLQVLVNLLKNAKDAMTDGRDDDRKLNIKIHKCFSQETEDELLRIEICDNGVGIKPENLTRIFSHGFTTKRNGHGFGLHACANACKEMGGNLSVSSPGEGLGATFVVDLPYKEAEVVA
ncbi:MAG: ATP-binding protein [Planctomycetota bacterium]